MSIITIKIKKEVSPTYITIPWPINESPCVLQYNVEVLVPGANLFVEIIASDNTGSGSFSEVEISTNTTYLFSIEAWSSSYSSENTINSFITLNVRSSAGGTILASVVLSKDHTSIIC